MKDSNIFRVMGMGLFAVCAVWAFSGCATTTVAARSGSDPNADIEALRQGHKDFYEQYFVKDPALYKKLFKEGQSPKTLIIACSDSRVAPEIVFGADPGDMFVVRNIANIVPPARSAGINVGTAAAIEYAVEHLHVRNIVVMGHASCGGINALMAPEGGAHGVHPGAIADWIALANPAKEKALKLEGATAAQAQAFCEKRSVENSVENLMTFPFVADKVRDGTLRVFGCYFSIEDGTIEKVCER